MMDDSPVIPNDLYPVKLCRFRSSKGRWGHVSQRDGPFPPPPTKLKLVTWNISYDAQWPEERLDAALEHLEIEVFKCRRGERPGPCCILLQEVNEGVLPALLRNEWVRDNFFVTPIDTKKWPNPSLSPYGNVTLIEKSLVVVDSCVVQYGSSSMGRTAVITDVKLRTVAGKDKIVRIINTHLESLPAGNVSRRNQMEVCGKLLREVEVSGGVVGGDMNAISPSDKDLPSQLGLRDAWWRKSVADAEDGYTWGYQGGGNFPKCRMDKFLFLPQKGFRLEEPVRIGIGVQTEEDVYVSDHYGLTTRLHCL